MFESGHQHRRAVLTAVTAAVGCVLLPIGKAEAQDTPAAPSDDFERALAAALATPAALEGARRDREGQALMFEEYGSRGITPQFPPSKRAISKHAVDLIIGFEVSSPSLYHQRYESPVVPGGQSGVTIGVGYDLGYVTSSMCRDDWSSYLTPGQVAALSGVCGKTKAQARTARASVKTIVIPWGKADPQFRTRVLPRYISMTLARVPNAAALSDDSLGALVSLIYNRGASFRKQGDRYREMRAIYAHMTAQDFDKIPTEIRSMKRLWQNDPMLAGLVTRRELEARLFQDGLAADAVTSSV